MKLADFLKLFKEGKDYSHSHMKNLIEMALADGNFDDSERTFLYDLAIKHKVSVRSIEGIENEPEVIVMEVPKDKKEKFHQLYDLVHMMVLDGEIHPDELKFCKLLAKRFGYSKENIDSLISSIKNNIQQNNDPMVTMSKVENLLD